MVSCNGISKNMCLVLTFQREFGKATSSNQGEMKMNLVEHLDFASWAALWAWARASSLGRFRGRFWERKKKGGRLVVVVIVAAAVVVIASSTTSSSSSSRSSRSSSSSSSSRSESCRLPSRNLRECYW